MTLCESGQDRPETLSPVLANNPPIESSSVGKPPSSRKGRGHFPRRRPKGFENRVNISEYWNPPHGTFLMFSITTPIEDRDSVGLLTQAARKALAASVLDSETALSHLPNP